MIHIAEKIEHSFCIRFIGEQGIQRDSLPLGIQSIVQGTYLQEAFLAEGEGAVLFIGLGKEKLSKSELMEAAAAAVQGMKAHQISGFSVEVDSLILEYGEMAIQAVVLGLLLGQYEFTAKPEQEADIALLGVPKESKKIVAESLEVAQGVLFAREMVNAPGNQLRPEDFAACIMQKLRQEKVELQLLSYPQLQEQHMDALCAVGGSSENPPCFLIIRYQGNPESKEILGMVGKGVTCDTGGYCLKSAASMPGIKGDMAGGAAVAGAIYALSRNQVKVNVTGCIPMCENRISRGSLLPGDVISSFAGKTIEVLNTDAEGRLILADAVAYAVQKEKVSKVLDIATLTGAVVQMLGFSIAGVMSDQQEFFEEFRSAYTKSGERYWRLPFYAEHEKMIKSKIADLKNVGESCCGTITAGLFIREFADKAPWLHLDIAGTAWVDTPLWKYQSKGATGAGVTTLYELGKGKEE